MVFADSGVEFPETQVVGRVEKTNAPETTLVSGAFGGWEGK
jgi:hypothetical protein